MQRWWFAVVVVPLAACAQLLSYDDYRAQPPDPGPDSAVSIDTAVDDASDTGEPPARTPARPSGAATASGGKTLWLAARTYSYGLGGPDTWRSMGYDLDEVCTLERDSVENRGTCLRPSGAAQDSLIDGDRCRDNNFARHVGGLLLTTLPDAEKTLNGLIRSGSTTWILRIDDVDAAGDDAYAPGAFYRSSDDRMTTPPNWDGADDRAVQSDSLVDSDLARPVIAFPRGYIKDGTWISGDPSSLSIIAPLTAVGFFPVDLESAFFSVELNETRTSAARGAFVGVLPATKIESMFQPIADFAIVCPGSMLYETALTNLYKTPDVVRGAPKLQDLDRTCDGVSTAIGFELTSIKPVTRVVPPSTPRKPRCGDAG